MQQDIFLLPGIADPGVGGRFLAGEVLDMIGDLAGLGLGLVVHDEDGELGGRSGSALLGGKGRQVLVNVLLELCDGVAQSGPRIVDLVLRSETDVS